MRNKEQNEKNNQQKSSTTKIILVVVMVLLISILARCAVSCQQRKMVNEIASGKIDANPYTRGTSHDACTYCPYGSICHQSEVAGRRNYKAMNSQEFWAGIEQGVKQNG